MTFGWVLLRLKAQQERGASKLPTPRPCVALLAQVQLLDDGTVACDIGLLEVTEEVTSVTNHLQHAAAAVMVLVVGLEVLGQSVDAMGKNRNLNLRGAGVALVRRVLLNNGLLFVFQHGNFHLSFYYAQTQRWVGEYRVTRMNPTTG